MTEIDQARLQQSLDGAFAPGELPFCHDAKYKLRFSDRWLCSLSEADQQRCPAFKQLCASKAAPEPQASSTQWGSSALGFLAEALFWLLIGVLVVALIVALRRMFVGRRDTAEVAAERGSLQPELAPAPPTPGGDTDVSRLLEKARRAADRGELALAIDSAHAAAVQGLAAAGRVEVDRDRTNGDYLRDLRSDPAVQQEFKSIVHKVEVTQFGGVAASRGAFDQVLDQVLALLRRLAVLAVLLCAAGALPGCSSGGSASQERAELAPTGLYTLRRLLADQGAKVRQRMTALGRFEDDVALIVVYDTELEDEQRDVLLRWMRQGGAVVVAGGEPGLEKAGEIEVERASCGHAAQRAPQLELPPLKLAVLGQSALELKPKSDSVVHRVEAVCGDRPYVATAYVGAGMLTFIAEPQLLTNASLSVADNARLVAEQLSLPEGGTIELVGPWTGDGSQSPIQSIKNAGLLPVMLQLLALIGLLALRQGTSFGARRDVTRRVRRAFADHVRALAATYARARAGRLASASYGLLLIDQLRERLCPGQKPSLFELAAAIARRVRRPETEIVQLLVEAKSTFDEEREGEAVNHEIIRELEQLSLQAGGIREHRAV
jgi:hypothetical protein